MVSERGLPDGVKPIEMAGRLLGRTILKVYAFVFEDIMVDSGNANSSKIFSQNVKDLSITRLVNTHGHEDHIGNNSLLQDLMDVRIFAHQKAVTYIENPMEFPNFYKRLWGQPKPSRVEALKKDHIASESENFTFQIIHTPGHTPCHISLYEANQGWIVTGDTIPLPSKKRESNPEANIKDLTKTLKNIRSLNVNLILDCHRGLISDPAPYLDIRIKYLENLMATVMEMNKDGLDPEEIRSRVFGRERFIVRLAGHRFNSLNTILSILNS